MSFMQIFNLVTGIMSGVALFIFGMNTMSSALSQIAGGNLSGMIKRITEKRIKGWIFGTTLAVFVQSSVTTVMTVGLVNSGIMKVTQAASVVIGANLGTTATAWLLSLNSLGGPIWLELLKPSSITPFLALGGIVYLMFANTDKKRSMGTLVVGFSVMMIGMDLMSRAVEPLQSVPAFNEMLLNFSNPVIGVGVGILCTLLIQSSAAAIGIMQALSMSVGITFGMAIPIVCGAQLGTCLTAILASLGSNNRGKRTALIHFFYNLIRNALFLVILYTVGAAAGLPFLKMKTSAVGIAAFHTAINLLGSLIFLPATNLLVKLVTRVIPYNKKERQEEADTLTILDPIFLGNPAFALEQVRKGTEMLADLVQNYYSCTMTETDALEEGKSSAEKVQEAELIAQRALSYAKQLRDYCIMISERRMQDLEARTLAFLQSTIDNYQEICEKITARRKLIEEFTAHGGHFSEEGEKDMRLFEAATQDILEITIHEFELRNNRLAETIQVYREIITDICGKIISRNVKRLHSGTCAPESSLVFSDLCDRLIKIIDRCDSIAASTLVYIRKDQKIQPLSSEKYMAIQELFKDKYSDLDD